MSRNHEWSSIKIFKYLKKVAWITRSWLVVFHLCFYNNNNNDLWIKLLDYFKWRSSTILYGTFDPQTMKDSQLHVCLRVIIILIMTILLFSYFSFVTIIHSLFHYSSLPSFIVLHSHISPMQPLLTHPLPFIILNFPKHGQ